MIEKRKNSLSIFIPISILSDVSSQIEKTFKVGQIARSASIFRVDKVVVYKDSPNASKEDSLLIKDLLSYAETPQYLRKSLFPLKDTLRYAGMIPPLRTPNHPLESTDTPYREGFVLGTDSRSSRVDIGLRRPAECPCSLPLNKRVTMKKVGDSWLPTDKSEVPFYWGYDISMAFKGLLPSLVQGNYDFIIATSRLGSSLSSVSYQLKSTLSSAKKIGILFGSPTEGVHEIIAREGKRLEDVANLIVNTVPDQGTATVRTEEAVMISLAAFSSIEAIL